MPNNDYILRDDVMTKVLAWFVTYLHGAAEEYLDEVIAKIPARDVVPVVRCRNCKYKPTAPAGIACGLQVEFPDKWTNPCPCLCEDGWYSWVPDDDFFCAYGARIDAEPPKEEDDEQIG